MRKEFELTERQYQELTDKMKPDPVMFLSGGVPLHRSRQSKANDAWDALGEKLGFKGASVQGVSGKSDRFFTAEVVEEG